MADGPFTGWTKSPEADSKLNLAVKMEEKGMSNDRIEVQINKAIEAEAKG